MSLTRQIAHNTITQIVGKIISTLFGLWAISMLTHYLGVEKFGWYITTNAFLQFIGIMIDFGSIVVTAQMLSEPFHDKEKLFKNLFAFRFFTALIFFGLAPFITIFFPYPPEVKIAIIIASIAYLTTALNQVFVGLYQTKLKMYFYSAMEVVGRILLVAGIWFMILIDAGFMPIIIVATLASVIQTLLILINVNRETKIGFAFDWNIWQDIIKKMWPIALSIIFNVVYLKGDLVLLSVYVSQTEVGLYGFAYRVLDIITQSAMMIMGTLMPLLAFAWSRQQKHEFKKYYQQAFDIMMLFAIPMMFGAITLSSQIIHFIAGSKFAASAGILSILAIAVFGVFLGAVFGHTAVAINRQKETLWIYISNAIITLIGYLIFIPTYGMYGAAWMSVFSELYAGILLFFTISHYTKEKIQFKTTFKIIFASLVMCFALLLLKQVHILISIAIGMIVYGTIVLLTKIVSQKTINEILNRG